MKKKKVSKEIKKRKSNLREAQKDFGYEFKKTQREKARQEADSFSVPANNDGSLTVNVNGMYGLLGINSSLDVAPTVQSEIDLITKYRELMMVSEIEDGVDQIISEMIIQDNNTETVTIDLSKCIKLGNNIEVKEAIIKEFSNILRLLNWNSNAYEIAKRWYVDGKMYYHTILDNNSDDSSSAENGILELRYIDPRQIKKVREVASDFKGNTETISVVDEYFVYNRYGITNTNTHANNSAAGVKITEDSIVYVHSGILDRSSTMILSHLHKAIKPANQLKMLEDSLIIYRLVRAPQRRVFNVDVGNLPTTKAEQYMQSVINMYRNNITYDVASGEISGGPRVLSMLEDYWVPKRDGTAGTTIDTVAGGENLGVIEDVIYFARKLYKALGIPISRLGEGGSGLNNSKATEVTRDELQFSRFIDRLRKRFSVLFSELLKKQLIAKRILTEDVWEEISEQIFYNFASDNYFAELIESEILKNRLELVSQIDAYVNKYYSAEWIREKVLRQSPDEQKKIDEQIARTKVVSNLDNPNPDAEPTGEFGAPDKTDSSSPDQKMPLPAQKVDEPVPQEQQFLTTPKTEADKPSLNGVVVNDKNYKFV